MDPRVRVELESERRKALERKLHLIQVALGRGARSGPAAWARRFEGQPRRADGDRTPRRKP